ncbi:beta-glucosidase family protein [Cellulomonas sp. SG140]|uniref:beta-d-glucosidase n=1 Tax=Cellulomonas sp. SG140 TaxID=2976536 RepID=UPI0021E94E8C|nr:glycoside hydrolase family 3 N-terminal domain-containing protein [Cellulomonas sp. SG140]
MALDTAQQPSTGTDALVALAGTLTLEEKVALVVGAGLWTTTAIPRIGLRAMVLSDGPAGVRGIGPDAGTSASFPAPTALAATWDVELADRVGTFFAAEAHRHGVDVVLAPQVNLQRTPVGGRHFECFSEDPLLTSLITVPLVDAAQRAGVAMCVKHFVANDSETDRTRYVSRVDERTLREVYLPPFEAAVRAGAWSVMGAYSGVDDGVEAAPALEHRHLLTQVLKDEWGFDGAVVSDWVATRSVAGAVRGGLDLQMPGPDGPWGDGLLDAVRAGVVAESELDDKVVRLLRLAQRVGALASDDDETDPVPAVIPLPDPAQVAAQLRALVTASMVVLRDHGLLPLVGAPGVPAAGPAPTRVALIGANAVEPFLQGGGSSMVAPDRRAVLADRLADALGVQVDVHVGARSRLVPPDLDLAACTTPDGTRGLRVELLDAQGTVLDSRDVTTWNGWLTEPPAAAASVRLRTAIRLTEPGLHEIGVGTVGAHRLLVDGVTVSSSDHLVGAEVILDSTVNHPVPATLTVAGPATVHLDATVQAVHPVGYDSFARALLVHRVPGPSAARLREDAVAAAAAADVAVVVVGTTEEVESEGWDRTSLALPGEQDALVDAVLAANPRTVVVVNAGAPVLLPWLDRAPCVVWGWLGGQEWPDAVADVLAGRAEPSGRLPWTLPARAQDVPVPDAVPVDGVVEYREGVHVGHRSWDLLDRTPAAPFGHGLGWTTWEHESATLADQAPDGSVELAVTVRNTGVRHGREVVQVYVEPPEGTPRGERPVRVLGGFAVVDAEPGVTTTVRVPVAVQAFRTWRAGGWTVPAGTYRLRIGRSSRDLRLALDVVQPTRAAAPQ